MANVGGLMAEEYVVQNLPRQTNGAPCKCGGYADRQEQDPNKEEIEKYDCGRGWACCTAVFICRLCSLRFIGVLDAPDMG